jgi:hypothetical protein
MHTKLNEVLPVTHLSAQGLCRLANIPGLEHSIALFNAVFPIKNLSKLKETL